MKKYKIENVGCDDFTEGVFEFTEEQFDFLSRVFSKLNEHSTYGCMPKIYIDPFNERESDAKDQKSESL
jgi:hypothetical protein